VADMQVQIEDQGPVKKRVSVTVPAQRVARQSNSAYSQLAQKVSVPGFRRGKVPQRYLEQRYGARVAADVAQELIEEGWRKALDEHGVTPVSQPEVDAGGVPKPSDDYSFSITVEVPPAIDLQPYEGIAVEMTEYNIPDDRVDHELGHIAENAATWESIADRDEARSGDQAIIDFKGEMDGEPLLGGEGTDNELELGSGRFIPGFEAQIIGHKVGEDFDIHITFPEDYGAQHLAGKDALFHITLKQLKQKVVPAIGPDLAAKLGEESIDKVREQVRENIANQWKEQAKRAAEQLIRKHLAGQYAFDLPPSMVDNAMRQDLEGQPEKSEEEREKHRTEVIDALRVQLVLDAVAEKENIEVAERDLSARIDEMARGMGQYGTRLRQMYRDPARRASLRARLRQEKVLEFLLSKANVTRVTQDVPAHDHGEEGASE
jgi:trigger factor